MLHEFIATHRQEIIARCQAKVATRIDPLPMQSEIEHGVPVFLEQLVELMRSGASSSTEIRDTAVLHGHDLLRQGYTVSQVVHDYGDICQSVTDLAVELDAPISTANFRTLNRCLDDAIAGAVTEFGRLHEKRLLNADTDASELVNLVAIATAAFNALKAGNVGVAGSTGAVVDRSLVRLGALATRLLDKATTSDPRPTTQR